jgi:cation diffusion facilitator family transporter
MRTKRGAAALSIASNSTLVVLKLIVGVMTGSVSVMSEAVHSAIDLVASVIAYLSVRTSDIPPDQEHPFGHGKIENVSGVVEAILIFLAAGIIIFEATKKLAHGTADIQPKWGLVVMAISVVANLLISRWLFRVARETDSVALEADGHHLSTDVWTSLGVFVGLLLIQVTKAHILDPIVAICVALLIAKVAFDLTREAGGPLVDHRLPPQEVERLTGILRSDRRIIGFHKLRTRKAGPQRHIDVHIIVPEALSVVQAHDLAEQIEDKIREELGGAQVVTHVEPNTQENLSDTPPEGLADNGTESE